MGTNSDAAEIEPVRVPAALHGDVGFRQAVGVMAAGKHQQLQLLTTDSWQVAADLEREIGRTGAVAWIGSLVLPADIVQHGEKFDHRDIGAIGRP